MTNWRAIAINLARLLPAGLAWGLAGLGMLGTAGVALGMWHRTRRQPASSWPFALTLLGTYAATCALTRHAHTHMSLLLIPLLLLGSTWPEPLPPALLNAWALIPPLALLLGGILWPGWGYNAAGLATFAVNLLLLGWGARALYRHTARPDSDRALR